MGRRRARAARAFAVFLVVVAGGCISLDGGAVRACSCGPVDPLSLVDDAEIVFTGSAIDTRDPETQFRTLTFEVDTVVKGEVPESFEIAAGATEGCGPDYAGAGQRHVVYMTRWQGRLGLTACAPLVSAAAFERLVGATRSAEGDSPIAAVGSGRLGLEDLVALDADGRPLGYVSIGASGRVAHCAGTTSAVIVDLETDGGVHLVDLGQFVISDSWKLSESPTWPVEVHCMQGARTIVVTGGSGHEAAPTSIASIDVESGEVVEIERARIAHTVVDPDGALFLLPIDPGDPIEVLDVGDLTTVAEVRVPPDISVVHGTLSPDGSQLALLVTIDGATAEYDTGGTDVLVLDVVDGEPVGEPVEIVHVSDSTGTRWPEPDGPPSSEPDPDAPGALRRIDWLGDGTWVIDEFAPAAHRVHVINDGVMHRDPHLERCGTDRVTTSAGLLCLFDGDVAHLDDGDLHPRDVARDNGEAIGSLASLIEPPSFNAAFPTQRQLSLTPIEQVGYDTGPAAAAMSELLNSDRHEFEDLQRSGSDRRWANRLGIYLVVAGLVGAVGWIAWSSRPNRF